ncbi:TonB-dependent receptor [Qipengyuania sp. JC766]|uniref:TonB-dependent receptor n=1 Tax=Qipengyuania sp. JC766 TaxID=3232139 RepID=UPI00345773D9
MRVVNDRPRPTWQAMRSAIRPSASILTLTLLAAPAMAQDDPETGEAVVEAEEPLIVVTGRGLDDPEAIAAYSVVELDREHIVSAPSGRIEDVLGNVAGFQQFRRSDSRSSNPSAQGATLRGLGGNATSRALVLLDGVPQADPFFGYIPFNALAPDRIGSIRITRGGGSGPFGAGALAGTIELSSADAETLRPVTASALVNDRGEAEASAIAAMRLGAGSLTVGGRWDRGEGFFTTPEGDRVPASAKAAFDVWSADLRAVAPIGRDIELQANGRVFRDDRTLRFEGADSSSEGQDASVRIVGRGDWEFDALGYVQARNFSNVVISSTRFVRVLDQRDTPSTGLGGKLEVRPPVGEDRLLRLGVDYRRSDGELQEDAYSAFTGALTETRRAGGTNSDFGIFAEGEVEAGAFTLTGGLRADRTVIADGFFRARDAAGAVVQEDIAPDRADWSTTYRAGAVWRTGEALKLRAAAYSGFRLPTLNELYRPFVVFPVVTQANAALENERLEGYEAGLDFTPTAGVAMGLTVFSNEVENAIANVTVGPDLRQRRNLPAIEARGIEAVVGLERGAFRFDGTLSYTEAEVRGEGPSLELDGNRPSQTPEFAASATLSFAPADGWLLAGTLRHVGDQFESDQETDVLPAVTTFGAYAQMPVTGRLAVVLRAENLTDERIVTRNSDGSIDLGTPRTVWGGLRWNY